MVIEEEQEIIEELKRINDRFINWLHEDDEELIYINSCQPFYWEIEDIRIWIFKNFI